MGGSKNKKKGDKINLSPFNKNFFLFDYIGNVGSIGVSVGGYESVF